MEEERTEIPEVKKKGPLNNLNPVWFIFFSLAIVFFLYQVIGGVISLLINGDDDLTADVGTTRVILSFAQYMFILVPSILLVMLQDNEIKKTFSLYKPKVSVLLLSVLAIIVIQPFLQSFVYLQNKLIFSLPIDKELLNQVKELFDTIEAMTMKLVQSYSLIEFLTVTFVIAVTPAICEEFLFRGLVFRNFQKVISAGRSIFFTGLFFALFHFHPFNLIPLLILGFFLTFIVYHSGSILTAILCHFINNLIAVCAVYFYGSESFGAADLSGTEVMQYIGLGAASLVFFLIITFTIRKYSVHSHRNVSL